METLASNFGQRAVATPKSKAMATSGLERSAADGCHSWEVYHSCIPSETRDLCLLVPY